MQASQASDRIRQQLSVQGLPSDKNIDSTITLAQAMTHASVATDATAPRDQLAIEAPDVTHLAQLDPEEGDGELQVVGELGRGGMGVVDLARQRSLRREVAVKRLRQDSDHADILFQEALITGYLEHPNIIPVHQLGVDRKDSPLLVMKRVEGIEWRDLILDDEHPAWDKFRSKDRLAFHLGVLSQACNAVHFAHSRGVVHRDLKPANVMIGDYGEVYVLDWGVAIRLDVARNSRSIVGTPAYMAPEMVSGDGEVSERTDVYLLGAILHEILTGRPRHCRPNLQATLFAALLSEPATFDDDVPTELAELCNHACARLPEERPRSAKEFKAKLGEYLAHAGARRLIAQARETFHQLEEAAKAPEDARFAALLGATRFGLQAALQQWNDAEEARDLLQRCLEVGIERELERRNWIGAMQLMSELPRSRPDFETTVDKLRAEERSAAHLEEELRRVENEHDERVSIRQRSGLVIATGAILAAACFATAWLERAGLLTFGYVESLVAGTGFVGLVGAGVVRFRAALFATTLNRRFVSVVLAFGVGILVTRIFGMTLGLSMHAILTLDLVVSTLMFALMGVAVDRRFYAVAVVALVAAIAATLAPSGNEVDIQGAAFLVGTVVVAATLSRTPPTDTD